MRWRRVTPWHTGTTCGPSWPLRALISLNTIPGPYAVLPHPQVFLCSPLCVCCLVRNGAVFSCLSPFFRHTQLHDAHGGHVDGGRQAGRVPPPGHHQISAAHSGGRQPGQGEELPLAPIPLGHGEIWMYCIVHGIGTGQHVGSSNASEGMMRLGTLTAACSYMVLP